MYLSFFDLLDLFLRFLTVGQLSIISVFILSKTYNFKTTLAALITVCLSAYLLLTAPIPDKHYGIFRGIFLLFTEVFPYIFWCFAFSLLNDDFHPKNWSKWIKVTLVLVFLWFIYFFGYLQGKGIFHNINHAFQLIPFLHIIFISIKDMNDDLVNIRRNVRIFFIISISLYFSFILTLELGDSSLRSSSIFSGINALLALLALLLTSIFSWLYFNDKFRDETSKQIKEENKTTTFSEGEIPLVYKEVYQKLCQLMLAGFYMETQLTIKELSCKLMIPEHQLRELINSHLGFRNFSDFLNSYRLPAACTQLADITKLRKPILTIALELGYGSIATFNRAFKAKMGETPKEYRLKFQK